MANNLDQNIHLYNDGKPFTARWDGKDYELGKKPTELKRGIAEHWIGIYKDAKLRIEDIPAAVIEQRKPANPLEANDRGKAFAALTKEPAADSVPGEPSAEQVEKAESSEPAELSTESTEESQGE